MTTYKTHSFVPYPFCRLFNTNMSKPAIVLVPGAWHKPQHLHKVIDGLEKSGYEAHGVALASVDSEVPITSWDKDAEGVRKVIVKNLDAGKDVIVIAHSYGGFVMSEAVKGLGKKARKESQGLETGVLRLIYMCAVAPRKGETVQDKTKPATEQEANMAARQMGSMKLAEVCYDPMITIAPWKRMRRVKCGTFLTPNNFPVRNHASLQRARGSKDGQRNALQSLFGRRHRSCNCSGGIFPSRPAVGACHIHRLSRDTKYIYPLRERPRPGAVGSREDDRRR